MEEFEIKTNSDGLVVTLGNSKFEVFITNTRLTYSLFSEDLHLKDVTSAILINSADSIIPLFPIVGEQSEMHPSTTQFEDAVGSGMSITIKSMFAGIVEDKMLQIPCSVLFKLYSSFNIPPNVSKLYSFLSVQIKIDFIPKDLSHYLLYGYAPLYAKNVGHLKLFPDLHQFDHEAITFYSNGWQSWSMNHLLQFDQKWPSCPVKIGRINMENQDQLLGGRYQSEWHSVITDTSSGSALVLGFITLQDQFSRILMDHVEENGAISWFCAYSQTDSLSFSQLNAGLLKSEALMLSVVKHPEAYGVLSHICHCGGINENIRPAPSIKSGWCSWYYYYTKIKEMDMISNLEFFKKNKQIPIGLIQLDDGYQTWISDWGIDSNKFNEKFPHGLEWLVTKIHSAGFNAGLWVAPFFMAEKSQFLADHPDWVLKNQKGKLINTENNWGHKNYALDLSQDEPLSNLTHMAEVVGHEWGFDFLKIDFIYASEALDAIYKNPLFSRAQILRRGVQAIRDGLGDNKTLLGCGAPLGPCVGLVDVMRIGTDTAAKWSPFDYLFTKLGKIALPALKATLRSTIQRSYMHNTWFYNDPDCVVVRENRSKLSLDEVLLQLTIFGLSGGQVLISDDESLVSKERFNLLNKILPPGSPHPKDHSSSMPIPLDIFSEELPTIYARTITTPLGTRFLAALINWKNKPVKRLVSMKQVLPYIEMKKFSSHQKFILFDFWNEKIVGISTLTENSLQLEIPPRGCKFLSIIPIPLDSSDSPIFLLSTLHILNGLLEIKGITRKNKTLSISLALPGEHIGDLFFYLPNSQILSSPTHTVRSFENQFGNLAKVHVFLDKHQNIIITY